MEFIGSDSCSDDDDNYGDDNNNNNNNMNKKRKGPGIKHENVTNIKHQNVKRLKSTDASLSQSALSPHSSSSAATSNNTTNTSKILNFKLSTLKYNNSENIYHSDKGILTLDIDKNGHYMIVGGHGCNVEQFKLSSLNSSNKKSLLSPEREVVPEPGTAIWSVKYNNKGTNFAVACISPTPTIYDRVCRKIVSFVRGDPYLADMSKTKGHVAVVTGIAWHPRDNEMLLTSSLDGSLRTWNLNGRKHFDALICNQVIKARDENGRRVGITSSCYNSTDGNLFAGVTSSGGLQIWKTKGGSKYDRPQFCNNRAHVDCSGNMSDITFVGDGRHLLTRVNYDQGITDTSETIRGGGVVKLWDVRKINKPLKTIKCCKSNENKCTFHLIENTTYLLCPSDSSGCNNKEQGEGGKGNAIRTSKFINIYNMADAKNDSNIGVHVETSSTCTMYHKQLNSLFIGESDGTVSRVPNFAVL